MKKYLILFFLLFLLVGCSKKDDISSLEKVDALTEDELQDLTEIESVSIYTSGNDFVTIPLGEENFNLSIPSNYLIKAVYYLNGNHVFSMADGKNTVKDAVDNGLLDTGVNITEMELSAVLNGYYEKIKIKELDSIEKTNLEKASIHDEDIYYGINIDGYDICIYRDIGEYYLGIFYEGRLTEDLNKDILIKSLYDSIS